MQKRDTIRQIPNRHPFVAVEMNQGTHHLRIPSHLTVAQLLSGLPDGTLETLATLDASEGVGTMSELGVRAMSALGALVGLAWYHSGLDLEAQQGADMLVYGAAVYEEMHGEGYTLSDVVLLGMLVLKAVWEASTIEKEVQERIAFFGQAAEPQSARSS